MSIRIWQVALCFSNCFLNQACESIKNIWQSEFFWQKRHANFLFLKEFPLHAASNCLLPMYTARCMCQAEHILTHSQHRPRIDLGVTPLCWRTKHTVSGHPLGKEESHNSLKKQRRRWQWWTEWRLQPMGISSQSLWALQKKVFPIVHSGYVTLLTNDNLWLYALWWCET